MDVGLFPVWGDYEKTARTFWNKFFFFFFWWTKTLISLGPQGGSLFSLSRNTGVVKGEHEAAWSASGTVG